jgi:P pilus assembly chaperone PapD
MKMKIGFWIALAVVVGPLGFGAAPAAAQVDLVVSPIRAEHQVQAGTSETNVILVKTVGTGPERIKVYLEDWQLDAKGDVTYSRAGTNPHSSSAWLQVNPTDFRLDPGTREVRYTLTVPPGVKPGTYWTAIVLESLPAIEGKQPIGRKMGVHGRIGVVVYETVGKPEIKADFKDFQVHPARGKLTFNLTLTNSGTAFYRIKKSWVILKNSQGKEVSRIEVPDIPVLPGTSRDLEFAKELTLPPGEYLAEAVLDVGRSALLGSKKNFTIGR